MCDYCKENAFNTLISYNKSDAINYFDMSNKFRRM